jgi:hypothetical protein
MSQAEYRKTYSWQGALALGPKLVILSEDLPSHEQTGLVMQISELMVELPAMVAADLVDGTSLRFAPLYRLMAALELIERVYPALDAGDAKQSLEELGERLATSVFEDVVAVPTLVPAAAPEATQADNGWGEPEIVDPAATTLVPAPVSVPVPEPNRIDLSAAPQPEQVTSVHVQPDSL